MIEAAIDEAFPAPVLTATHYERFSCRGESGFAYELLFAKSGGHLEKPDDSSCKRTRDRFRDSGANL
jgi:6-phosphogluconate dehydrogenase